MASGPKQESGSIGVIVGGAFALLILASPLYLRLLESGASALRRDVDAGVERVQRMAHQVDENLVAIADLRGRISALAPEEATESSAASESESGKPAELRGDRLISGAERLQQKMFGRPDDATPPKRSIQQLLDRSTKLLADADREIKAVLGLSAGEARASDHQWANRTAAMVGLARGRVERDRAWWDRWQAGELARDATQQEIQLAELRRRAESAKASSPDAALQQLKAYAGQLEKAIQMVKSAAASRGQEVDELKARVAGLREKARAAAGGVAKLDAEWQKAADGRSARAGYESSRSQYAALAAEMRTAEREADTLEHGALAGGGLSPKAEGDYLEGAYDGGEPTTGLVQMQAEYDAARKIESELAAQIVAATTDAEQLESVGKKCRELNELLERVVAEREEALKASQARVAELRESAEKADAAAIAAFTGGVTYVTKAQTAARKRASDATKAQQEAGGEQKSKRLEHIIGDKDSEAGVLVLGANLAWAAAETYAQAILDARAVAADAAASSQESESSQPADSADGAMDAKVKEWRSAANEMLAKASKFTTDAKNVLAQASYETNDGQRIAGAAYRWQVNELEAAVHMLSAVIAENEEAAETARGLARTALSEALKGRESSPLLAHAAAALESIKPGE